MDKLSKFALKRQNLSYSSDLGRHYLQLRKKSLRLGLSKTTAIPYALRYLEEFPSTSDESLKIADFGCSEGSVLREIQQLTKYNNVEFYGIDFNESLLEKARNIYLDINFYNRNIYQDDFSKWENMFDIALSINTVHEIFSFYGWNGVFNKKKGLKAVRQSLQNIASTIKPNGIFILFDGVEADTGLEEEVKVEFPSTAMEKNFLRFVDEYKPYKLNYKKLRGTTYVLDMFSFTKFLTKYVYIESKVWSLEREESYQYYTKSEFENIFCELGLEIESINQLSPNIGLWNEYVSIKSPGVSFPNQHILIVGRKKGPKV